MKAKRIANTFDELRCFLAQTLTHSVFEIEEVSFSDQREWLVKDGVISHRTNGFFHVSGYKDHTNEHLVLYQPQGAFNGLIVCKHKEKVYVLVQARVEPGNVGIVQYGPTVQSTPANYLQLHGGKPTPYLDFFFSYKKESRPLWNSCQLDIGKRYYQKSKTLSYVEVPELIFTDENMIWVPLEVLCDNIAADNIFNTDLRSMLAVFDWDEYLGFSKTLPPNKYNILLDTCSVPKGSLVSIDCLKNWDISDSGVSGVKSSSLHVKMFKTTCRTREVGVWFQPLMCVSDTGKVVLCVKKIKGSFHVLLTAGGEFGAGGENVWLPSFLHYPEEIQQDYSALGRMLCEVRQSEEGGRFYENVNKYELIEVDAQLNLGETQYWVPIETFKQILKTSNSVSIQLRCIASLMIRYMNKHIMTTDTSYTFFTPSPRFT